MHTLRQCLYKLVKLCLLERIPELLIVDFLLRHTKCDIFPDIRIQQENHLWNISDIGKPLPVMLLDVNIVCKHLAALQL